MIIALSYQLVLTRINIVSRDYPQDNAAGLLNGIIDFLEGHFKQNGHQKVKSFSKETPYEKAHALRNITFLNTSFLECDKKIFKLLHSDVYFSNQERALLKSLSK